ncbi:SAM domain-containing protein SAMSN-1-like [Arapaima gigas]
MNLFCFSLEGSMDSLYEPVKDDQDTQVYTIPSRPCSPEVLSDESPRWRGSVRSISTEFSQFHNGTLKKKKKKTLMPKSASDNEAKDSADCNNIYWQPTRKGDDLIHVRNDHREGKRKDLPRVEPKVGEGRGCQAASEKRKGHITQVVNFDVWNVHQERPCSRQQNQLQVEEVGGEMTESRGENKKAQSAQRGKKGGQKSPRKSKSFIENHGDGPSSKCPAEHAAVSCISLARRPDKQDCRPSAYQPQETTVLAMDLRWSSGPPPSRQRWSSPPWGTTHHTCCQPLTEYRIYTCDLTLPRHKNWECQDPPAPRIIRSITDLDLWEFGALQTQIENFAHILSVLRKLQKTVFESTAVQHSAVYKPKSNKPKRSTSLGKFDVFKHQSSPSRPEENDDPTLADEESGAESNENTKSGSLGMKMRAISMTMRKKMCKKYAKATCDEMDEGTDQNHEGDVGSNHHMEKEHRKTNSVESLCSGQSSSSGVTSGSDGSSNRDSLRLEDDIPYTGQFCGRARVHTDFVPSPYDTDSLKLKVGDVIDIISKPPMGIWTGMLNNKVGNFKFIYVDLLVEKDAEPLKIRPHRRSKRPRPKTLQELLGRLNLQEYTSTLLLNGYQTVEDLKDLQEKHLIELNMMDPEHRQRLLAAAESLQDTENNDHSENEGVPDPLSDSLKVETNEYPRDSGCYVSSESSDNGKDDAESQQEEKILTQT